jgi:hypothetical protein
VFRFPFQKHRCVKLTLESATFLCTDISSKGPFKRKDDHPSRSILPLSSTITTVDINAPLSSTFSTMEGLGVSRSVSIHLSGGRTSVEPVSSSTRYGQTGSPSTSVSSHGDIATLSTRPSTGSSSIGDITPTAYETPTRLGMLADEVSNLSRNSVSLVPGFSPPQSHISPPTPSSSDSSSSTSHHGNLRLITRPTLESNANIFARKEKDSQARYKQLLYVLKQAASCSLCWLFSDAKFDHLPHRSAYTCPRNIMDTLEYGTFRSRLRFMPNSRMCWKCCEPQHPPFDHPKGTDGCKYNDVVKPIAYVIFQDDQLRAKVFGKMQMPANRFSSISNYRDWLVQRQGAPGSMVNIHEVLLAYYELYPYGGTN